MRSFNSQPSLPFPMAQQHRDILKERWHWIYLFPHSKGLVRDAIDEMTVTTCFLKIYSIMKLKEMEEFKNTYCRIFFQNDQSIRSTTRSFELTAWSNDKIHSPFSEGLGDFWHTSTASIPDSPHEENTSTNGGISEHINWSMKISRMRNFWCFNWISEDQNIRRCGINY